MPLLALVVGLVFVTYRPPVLAMPLTLGLTGAGLLAALGSPTRPAPSR
ncbi:hypothetical protein JK361_38485 [Streptomyces sp. 5-8]|uniref:Uncharacterized protein n=1 Tax=Streptomyces musisoli TaxID=2802280 RepID=A0ABS1PDB7_9ACTN|nr:hypothetical protein [Streptomyces musisoli]MBL1110376.1 hypothetical protein [Streptomyces musisoli]